MSELLSQGKIGTVTLNNKVVMAPMCMYKSDSSSTIKPFHLHHYSARAIGGVGLIIVEATAIEPKGRISDNDLGIWSQEQIDSHKKLVDEVHSFNTKIALQIAHAGRKSTCKDTTPIAPSALAFSPNTPYKMPEELSLDDIKQIKKLFLEAAVNAKNAGYDLVELHSAHGYLLYEFLSPLTNKRDDIYGGSIENRSRLTLEIAKEIKQTIDIPLLVRLSADEWMDNGWDIEDSIYLSKELEKIGVDCIDVSAGGNHEVVDHMPELKPLYQCDYARKIKQNVSIPVIAVGLITTPSEGETLLKDGYCDFVAYARELLRSPNLVFIAAKEFDKKEIIETSYQRAY